jgi:hypothetical protein
MLPSLRSTFDTLWLFVEQSIFVQKRLRPDFATTPLHTAFFPWHHQTCTLVELYLPPVEPDVVDRGDKNNVLMDIPAGEGKSPSGKTDGSVNVRSLKSKTRSILRLIKNSMPIGSGRRRTRSTVLLQALPLLDTSLEVGLLVE